jgi:hypothetical protein
MRRAVLCVIDGLRGINLKSPWLAEAETEASRESWRIFFLPIKKVRAFHIRLAWIAQVPEAVHVLLVPDI